MDLKQIEKLMGSMVRSGITRFVLKKEGFEIELERSFPDSIQQDSSYRTFDHFSNDKTMFIPNNPSLAVPAPDKSSLEEAIPEGTFISSPMVGTFYSTPSPDQPPYIKVGDHVSEDTVVCIIEAMKVMNEVKAGVSGVVAEVLVDNSDPVQFGTKLFRIEEKS